MNHYKSDQQEEGLKTNIPFCFLKDRIRKATSPM